MYERKVVQITDKGVCLCNDGSMWERMAEPYQKENGTEWREINNVPQPKIEGPENMIDNTIGSVYER